MNSQFYIEKAQAARKRKDLIKYAKKALKADQNAMEASLMIISQMRSNHFKEQKLKQLFDNFFKKTSFKETRFDVYVNIATAYMVELMLRKKYRIACLVGYKCIDNIKDPEPNGLREEEVYISHLILHCLAHMGEYEKAMELCNEYQDKSLATLVPKMILEYRNGDMVNFVNTVEEIRKVNSYFIEILSGYCFFNAEEASDVLDGCLYEPGDKTEVFCLLQEYVDLIFEDESLINWFRNRDLLNEK